MTSGERTDGRFGPALRRIAISPGFAAYWIARTTSMLGDYAFRIAFIASILKSSDSPNVLSLATAVLLVPAVVLYIFGGAVGDRVRSRRAVLVLADIIRCLGTAAAAISVILVDSPVPVVLFALVIGIGTGFFEPVAAGFLVQIVPRERLVSANAALSVSRQIGLIGGPVLGGILVAAAGSAAAFWFDAATFAVSALALTCIPATAIAAKAAVAPGAPATANAGGQMRKLLAEIIEGMRYVAGVPWLRLTLLVLGISNAVFAGGLDVLAPLVFLPDETSNTVRLGLFYTLEGVGALLGAVILARLTVRRVNGYLFGMLALMAASLAMVGIVGDSDISLTFALSYGVGMHFFNSLYPALVQSTVPPQLISRVSSLEFLAFDGLMPIGIVLMGPLAIAMGSQVALVVTGAAIVLLCLGACAAPSVRDLRFPDRAGEPDRVAADPKPAEASQ